MAHILEHGLGMPEVVDRSTFEAKLEALRLREKAHTREGDAIAAARRRLPMVAVNATTPVRSDNGRLSDGAPISCSAICGAIELGPGAKDSVSMQRLLDGRIRRPARQRQ